jgi:hypothetical protein
MGQVGLVKFLSLPAFPPFRLKGCEIVAWRAYFGERRFRLMLGFNALPLFRHVILLVVLIQFIVEAGVGQKECALRPDKGEECATDTFAVPPCFAVLSREQPFRVQIHPCSVTGVPGGSYFCFQKHRFAATAHKAVSVCLRLWLAPSANSLLPGDQPTSLAQRLFGISLREYTLLCDLSRSNLTR